MVKAITSRSSTGMSPRTKKVVVAVAAVFVAYAGFMVWAIVTHFPFSEQQRAAMAALDRTEMQKDFVFKNRFSEGRAKHDFQDVYVGPASELSPSILHVPASFESGIGGASTSGGRVFLAGWSVRQDDRQCTVSLLQDVDPSRQRAFGQLAADELAAVRAGRQAVVEVSAVCE